MKIEIEEATPGRIGEELEMQNRHNFLRSLGKWSLAAIGCASVCSASAPNGTAWANMGGGWMHSAGAVGSADRGALWIDSGSWIDEGETVGCDQAEEPHGRCPRSLGAIS